MQALVDQAVAGGIAPGIVIGVVIDGKTFIVAAGKTSDQDTKPPDATTLFEIGSVTKTFTSTLLAAMVVEKKLTLETPLSAVWPGFTVTGDEVRLVDLATHHSGFPPMPANFAPRDLTNPYADYTLAHLDHALHTQGLAKSGTPPYAYSNFAVSVLGQALAKAADSTFGALVTSKILVPLKMNDTQVDVPRGHATRVAQGHDRDGLATSPWDFQAAAPAGAIRSTARDMLRYAEAQLGAKGPLAEAIALTHVPVADAPNHGKVALGWHLTGHGLIWHNGETGGFHTFLGIDAVHNRAVIVLANAAGMATDALGAAAFVVLDGKAPELPTMPTEVTLPAGALDGLVGRYLLQPDVEVTVTQKDGQLFEQLTGQPALRLHPSSATQFYLRVVEAQVTFELGPDGKARSLTIFQGGQTHVAVRAP